MYGRAFFYNKIVHRVYVFIDTRRRRRNASTQRQHQRQDEETPWDKIRGILDTTMPADGKLQFLLNSVESLVQDSIDGVVMTNGHLMRLDGYPSVKVVVRRDVLANEHASETEKTERVDKKRVHVLSGGGSGHEPAFVHLVGKGGLDAAICGDVFSSPSEDAVLAALRACVQQGDDVLVVVMNYTGDRLNFGAAVEKFKAEQSNIDRGHVRMLIASDDVALRDEQGGGRKTGTEALLVPCL